MWKFVNLYLHRNYSNKSLAIVAIVMCSAFNLLAQNESDLSFVSNTIDSKLSRKESPVYLKNVQNNKGELDVVMSGLFLFYKTFLSSQDMNSCNFHPSCSEYAIQSIKKKGFIHGGLMAFDRLGRCNGFSPEKYAIDIERRKLSDPVK
jgi:uncharacterized protein